MLKACPCPLSRSYPNKNRINIGQNGLHQMPNMCKKQQQAFLQLHNLHSYILLEFTKQYMWNSFIFWIQW